MTPELINFISLADPIYSYNSLILTDRQDPYEEIRIYHTHHYHSVHIAADRV